MKAYLDKIQGSLSELLREDLESYAETLSKVCESPIEIALALSLVFWCRTNSSPLVLSRQSEMNDYGRDTRLLVPQFKIDDKRIDFFIIDHPILIYVECDGHEFHERTKEQAVRDRRRDRQLQQRGIPVLRFTGSEIYADPIQCAIEIFDIINDLHMYDYMRRTGT